MKKTDAHPATYYFNEEGLLVFTEWYHIQRGFCCGNGCKHCPYNYEKVLEPKRTQLQQATLKNTASNETNKKFE